MNGGERGGTEQGAQNIQKQYGEKKRKKIFLNEWSSSDIQDYYICGAKISYLKKRKFQKIRKIFEIENMTAEILICNK